MGEREWQIGYALPSRFNEALKFRPCNRARGTHTNSEKLSWSSPSACMAFNASFMQKLCRTIVSVYKIMETREREKKGLHSCCLDSKLRR